MKYEVDKSGEKWFFSFIFTQKGSEMPMLIGEYQYIIDSKGRLNFPPKFREEMGESFFITRWVDGCLIACSKQEWDRMEQLFFEKSTVQSSMIKRFLYANAMQVQPDKQGRVLLTASLRMHANIEKEVTIVGVGNRAEIWASNAWCTMTQSFNHVQIAETMAEMGF